MTVEQVYPNLFAAKLLHTVPFVPDERRGGVLGLIGRLANEPAIPEDSRPSGSAAYKGGVTPKERKANLLKLWGWLTPYRGNGEVAPLLDAIKEEMETVDPSAIPEYEETLRLQAEAQEKAREQSLILKAQMAERHREREAEEERKTKEAAMPKPMPVPVIAPVIAPVVNEEIPESFEELVDGRTECAPASEDETFHCVACNGEFPLDQKMTIDGQHVCQSCHEVFA